MFSSPRLRSKNRRVLLTFCLTSIFSIGSNQSVTQADETENDITEQLAADASLDAIADHLLLARKNASVTRALAIHFPNIKRARAYEIQMALLAKMEAQGERLVGWKMGGTKIAEPGTGLDPVFGFMLASDEIKSGSKLKSKRFATATPIVEAEVCFWLKRDLPGPKISREQLASVIGGVGGASELISVRLRDAQGGIKAGVDLGIADGLSHGGFILPAKQFPLDEVDFTTEVGRVIINGEERAKGEAKLMMNGKPLDAVLALANELPKHGRHLRAGDIVIIGSMLESPPATTGDQVEIKFSSFGTLEFSLD